MSSSTIPSVPLDNTQSRAWWETAGQMCTCTTMKGRPLCPVRLALHPHNCSTISYNDDNIHDMGGDADAMDGVGDAQREGE